MLPLLSNCHLLVSMVPQILGSKPPFEANLTGSIPRAGSAQSLFCVELSWVKLVASSFLANFLLFLVKSSFCSFCVWELSSAWLFDWLSDSCNELVRTMLFSASKLLLSVVSWVFGTESCFRSFLPSTWVCIRLLLALFAWLSLENVDLTAFLFSCVSELCALLVTAEVFWSATVSALTVWLVPKMLTPTSTLAKPIDNFLKLKRFCSSSSLIIIFPFALLINCF